LQLYFGDTIPSKRNPMGFESLSLFLFQLQQDKIH